MSEPTQDTASTTDTAVDGLVPPGAEEHGPEDVEIGGDPIFEVAKLTVFLEDAFPGERNRSNRQVPESPVDTAIRLLQALSASAPLSVLDRCQAEYCNRPAGHDGDHGWVHNG